MTIPLDPPWNEELALVSQSHSKICADAFQVQRHSELTPAIPLIRLRCKLQVRHAHCQILMTHHVYKSRQFSMKTLVKSYY